MLREWLWNKQIIHNGHCQNLNWILSLFHSGPRGCMYDLGPLEQWDHKYKCHLKHGCISMFFCAMLSCAGTALVMGWSLIQVVLSKCQKRFTVSEVNSGSEQERVPNLWNVQHLFNLQSLWASNTLYLLANLGDLQLHNGGGRLSSGWKINLSVINIMANGVCK